MTKHPWDVLPKEEMGDADKNTTFIAVGHALSEWEGLEAMLASIFAALCETTSEVPARAYGMVASHGGRIDMLREAFRCYRSNDDPKLASFDKFLDRVRNFAARRNEIAHGTVISIVHNGVYKGCFLIPAQYNSRKVPSWFERRKVLNSPDPGAFEAYLKSDRVGKYCYTGPQIDTYRERFRSLLVEALDYYVSLGEREAANEANDGNGDVPSA